MKNKRLLALDSSNSKKFSSEQSEPTSKKAKSLLSPVRAKDSNGIFYSDDESPIDEPVGVIPLLCSKVGESQNCVHICAHT